MIRIGSTGREMDPALLRSPGGFAWWYADLVDPRGDGLVLIWSFGLPFLPGYAEASRRGAPQLPADRPSVNLAAYSGGVPVVYLLQEYPAGEASWPDALTQRIGRCSFARTGGGGRCTLSAELDCPVPGSAERLTGNVRIEGVARISPADAPADAAHVWTPLTGPAEGRATLRMGGREVARVSGRAYHDRNAGSVPLQALGIERWMWGRFPLPDREVVYYLLWPRGGGAPECLGVVVRADGSTEEAAGLEVELGRERRSFAGLRWPERIRLRSRGGGQSWLEVTHRALADVGPFYLRLLSEGTVPGGGSALGWGELCVPDRVDLPAHRPFVRMRVHRVGAPNSLWLPLFTGPRERRVARLLRHALSGGRG